MQKQLTALTAALAASVMATGVALAEDVTKVGFVYVGPVEDLGWTYRHDIGRLAVEAAYGDKVETTYLSLFQKDQRLSTR